MNKKFNVFISGQKHFGEMILGLCIKKGLNVVGVCCPMDDKYLKRLANLHDIPIIPAGMLNGDTFPDNVDLGITAHSFDYVGKRTRYKARLGWIGYHPSLLPVHRGRSAIQWAIKMKDIITGGTVFWLNSGIDRGDVAYRDFVFIDPKYFSMKLKDATSRIWREDLQPLGIELMSKALDDIPSGTIIRMPQKEHLSTFEPSMDIKDVFKPDLLMIEQYASKGNY
jgi:methionyl-tRNA formyltransferase